MEGKRVMTEENSPSNLFWDNFTALFISNRITSDNLVAAVMIDSKRRPYLAVWSVPSTLSLTARCLRPLSCRYIRAFFPLPARFKFDGVCMEAYPDGRGDDDAVVVLHGRGSIVMYSLELEEENEFRISLREELEIGTMGAIKRRNDISAECDNSFLSVSCYRIGIHFFVVVCCSDGSIVIRNSELQRIRTLSYNLNSSSSLSTKEMSAKMAIFVDDNTIISGYEYGHVVCHGVDTNSILWSLTLQSESIQKDDEFISSLHYVQRSKRLVIGTQVGNVYILQCSGGERSEELHRCHERSVINLCKFLPHGSTSKANSVLFITDLFVQSRDQFVVIITSALVAVVNIEDGNPVDVVPFGNDHSISLPIAEAYSTGTNSLLLLPAFDRRLFLWKFSDAIKTDVVTPKKGSNIKAIEERNDDSDLLKSSGECKSVGPQSYGRMEVSLSYFQTMPVSALPKESPLIFQYEDPLAEVKMKQHAFNSADWSQPGKDKNGKLVDRPVTFHTRIKSSGYGAPSSSDLWKTKQERLKQERLKRQSKVDTASSANSENEKGGGGKRLRMYPVDLQFPPTVPSLSSIQIASAVHSISYSEDAASMGILSSADTAVVVARLPSSMSSYMGHDGRVTSISFSHGTAASMILSSSLDGSVRLWSKGNVDRSSIVFAHVNHSVPSPFVPFSQSVTTSTSTTKASVSTECNRPFSAPINASRFFYMDNFVMIGCKNSIHMYKFKLPKSVGGPKKKGACFSTTDNLSSMYSEGTYRSAHFWSLASQSVSTFACINSVNSNLIVAAGSDKKMYILDANNGAIARTISSQHDTAVHHISIPTPSAHVQLPIAAYNIFATAAKDNCVLLWDLRQPTAVSRLSTHVNRREAVECAISPCLQYLAVGSEDFKARVYDMVAGKEIVKLPASKDVVSGVAWNPLKPQLATCSFDGIVRFYHM